MCMCQRPSWGGVVARSRRKALPCTPYRRVNGTHVPRETGNGREVRPGSGKHVKDQLVTGDSNTGAIMEGGRTGTGKDVSGVGSRGHAGAEKATSKERVRVESRNMQGLTGPLLTSGRKGARRSGHWPRWRRRRGGRDSLGAQVKVRGGGGGRWGTCALHPVARRGGRRR